MPYKIVPNSSQCPSGKPHALIKSSDGKLVACHPTISKAQKQMAALYAQEQAKSKETDMSEEERATWTTSYINDLPDSSFLYIEAGGSKDSDGKTTPRSLRHFPVKDVNGKVDLPHLRNALARIPQSNLPQSVKDSATAKAQKMLKAAGSGENSQRPPRDELVRALPHGFEVRDDGDRPPVMVGHFARWNEWTEIDSIFEGHFMERIAPGAFKKTFDENGSRMRVLFQHGQDPQIGDKPLGTIDKLEEDREGAYYEVPLLDAPYVRDNILPGLRAGLYGSSFRFSVQREQFNRDAKPSDYNPKGLPERTLKELAVREFGPVTFPAYAGATAGVRSLTDQFMLGRYTRDPEIARQIVEAVRLDSEGLGILARMIELGTDYIGEQDEPGDEANIPVMEDILVTLTKLAQYEANEDEGDEPEDEPSVDGRHAPPDDAAHRAPRNGTPQTQKTWPRVSQEEWEELEERWNRRI
jgi:HK97 family phage prohead protease